MRAAVFLDRDGVVNDLVPDPVDGRPESPLRVEQVQILPGVAGAVDRLRAAGFLLVAASNQPAAAKGKTTYEELRAIHDTIAGQIPLDDWRYCFHRAEDGCPCRKPKPGLLLEAIADHNIDPRASWFVGDADTDIHAGRAAGVRTILVGHPGSEHRRAEAPDVRNLSEAAAFILGD